MRQFRLLGMGWKVRGSNGGGGGGKIFSSTAHPSRPALDAGANLGLDRLGSCLGR